MVGVVGKGGGEWREFSQNCVKLQKKNCIILISFFLFPLFDDTTDHKTKDPCCQTWGWVEGPISEGGGEG